MATFATRQVHQSGGSDFETVVSRVKPLVKRLMKSGEYDIGSNVP